MQKYLTMDVGGTFVKYSLMDRQYQVYEEGEEPTQKDPERFLEQLLAIGRRCARQAAGIAVCIGGFINPETGENTDFSVGKNFTAHNLRDAFGKASGLPVVLENDSNCAALGELAVGAGRKYRDFILLTIGTGVGGAIIHDGKLLRGSHFKAGEAGLLLVQRVADGDRGYESAGATAELTRRVYEAIGERVDGVYIFSHLDDARIESIYREWLEKLAVAVGNTAVFVDPKAVLIGGGSCRQERFLRDLSDRVYSLYPHLRKYTQIEACSTGNRAGRIGALSLLLAGEGARSL